MDRLNAWNRLPNGGRLLVENPQAADLDVPLTNSIIPQRGVGSLSFTRATIATVTDNEWVIRNCIAGEARFQGARRVRNLHTYSEDITNAVWNPASCTRTKNAWIAPDGTNTAWLVTSAAATALTEFNQNYNIVSGQTYILSVSLKANGWLQYVQLVWNGVTFWVWYINVDLSNGTITANVPWAANMQATVTPEANWFYRIQFKATAISTLANNHLSVAMIPFGTSARIASFPWDGIKWFYYWHPQFEDVTGQSVQAAGEYVSTNVLNAAPYHGSNVDGVKCFKTDISGNPISSSTLKGFLCEWARTNICNYSNISVAWWGLIASTRTDNAWIAPDGTNSMVKIIPNAGTQSSYAYNVNITTSASIYTISCYVKADWFNFVQLRMGAGISSGLANFDLQNGVVWTRSIWTSSGIEAVSGFPWVYRIWAVTDTVLAATAAIAIQIVPAADSIAGAAVTGDWVSGILAWGMQIELWANVSTYIPTTTTTVTRNIDVLTYDVRNAIANKWALSVVCSMNDNALFDRRAVALSSFTINRLHVQGRAGWVPDKLTITYWDGVTVRSVTGAAVWTNNIAVSWTNWVWLNLYMNNIKYIGAFVPSLVFSTIDVGGGTLWYSLFWCTKNLKVWKTVPTDAELLSLSNKS